LTINMHFTEDYISFEPTRYMPIVKKTDNYQVSLHSNAGHEITAFQVHQNVNRSLIRGICTRDDFEKTTLSTFLQKLIQGRMLMSTNVYKKLILGSTEINELTISL